MNVPVSDGVNQCQSVLALHYAHAISLQFPPSETSDNIVVKL